MGKSFKKGGVQSAKIGKPGEKQKKCPLPPKPGLCSGWVAGKGPGGIFRAGGRAGTGPHLMSEMAREMAPPSQPHLERAPPSFLRITSIGLTGSSIKTAGGIITSVQSLPLASIKGSQETTIRLLHTMIHSTEIKQFDPRPSLHSPARGVHQRETMRCCARHREVVGTEQSVLMRLVHRGGNRWNKNLRCWPGWGCGNRNRALWGREGLPGVLLV